MRVGLKAVAWRRRCAPGPLSLQGSERVDQVVERGAKVVEEIPEDHARIRVHLFPDASPERELQGSFMEFSDDDVRFAVEEGVQFVV